MCTSLKVRLLNYKDKTMNRAIIIILDSLGLGASADAAKYGDQNSDTFGHIVEACEAGLATINNAMVLSKSQIYYVGD